MSELKSLGMSVEEAHRRYAFGGKACAGCKTAPGEIRIKVFMPADELMKRAPNVAALIMATNSTEPGKLPVTRFKESKTDETGKDYVKASDTVWCRSCRVGAQLEAARNAPSWAVVEIDEGPKDTVQVGYRA